MTADNAQSTGYPLDAENIAEMARLTRQARVITAITSLLPPNISLHAGQSVLDISCGPGEWLLALAEKHPDVEFIGFDISQLMTSYARSLATEQALHNIQFQVMDARAPLDFPDQCFDIVHARYITTFLTPATWPKILAECYRILKPGGTLISIEPEGVGINTSPSLTRLNILGLTGMHRAGRCFTSEGEHFGITAVQPKLLREAGFTAIRREAFILDYSFGSPAHSAMVQDLAIVFQLSIPFMSQMGLATPEELTTLHSRMIEEMNSPDFCAVGYPHRIHARK